MITTEVTPKIKSDRQFDVGDLVCYSREEEKNFYVVLITDMTGRLEGTFSGINFGPSGTLPIGEVSHNYTKASFRKFYGTVKITQEPAA